MNIAIFAQPVLRLPLTTDQITYLTLLGSRHYDGACKAAVADGGFLTRWGKQIACHDAYAAHVRQETPDEVIPPYTVDANMDQVQICLKILELRFAFAPVLGPDADVACKGMHRALSGAFELANGKYREWQAIFLSERSV